MSQEENVQALLEEMPEKVRKVCEAHALELSETMDDDEEIIMFTRCSFPFGTLFVTPERIIIQLQDGGVDTTNYADVASFSVIEGKKKFIGGYSETMFNTQMRDGRGFTGQGLYGDAWAVQTARAMVEAHKRYSLRRR